MNHMTYPLGSRTYLEITSAAVDRDLLDLIDAIASAVDISRSYEIDQLGSALEPFRGVALFDAELRLNGTASVNEFCICGGEEL